MQLRPYQQEAVQVMLDDFLTTKKSIVSLPTGGGKSVVIADFINKLNESVVILQPSQEILIQNKNKLLNYVPESEVAVYSASLKSKKIAKYTFATIQSAVKHTELFREFKVVIIDECHGYNSDGGSFVNFVKKIPFCKVYGLTATPYRHQTENTFNFRERTRITKSYLRMMTQMGFDEIIYLVNTKELTDQGFLCSLVYKTHTSFKTNFNLPSDKKMLVSLEKRLTFGGYSKILPILHSLSNFKSVVVFCPTVAVAEKLQRDCWWLNSASIDGKTPQKHRKQILDDFRSGEIHTIFNCGVLTTGFDHPSLDCIVLARPTNSLILLNQMLGRGTRNAPQKENCTVIDITGTVEHFGELNDIVVISDNVICKQGYMKNKIISFNEGEY
jgi:DNA repair protein RadD